VRLREADWIDRVLFAKGDAPRCRKMMCRFSLCGERFATGTIPNRPDTWHHWNADIPGACHHLVRPDQAGSYVANYITSNCGGV
jgi:hypothetical protein